MTKAKQTNPAKLLTAFQKFMTESKSRLDQLESRISALEGESGLGLNTEAPAKPLGPRPKIDNPELFERRDAYVIGLEAVWPDLEPRLYKAVSPAAVRKVFLQIAPSMPIQSWLRVQLPKTAGELFDFVKSGRLPKGISKRAVAVLRRDGWERDAWKSAAALPTRHLANAIAGAPQISWQRSLARCSKEPCHWPLSSVVKSHFGIIPTSREKEPS